MMKQITDVLADLREELVFKLRAFAARFVLKHWNSIGIGTFLLTVVLILLNFWGFVLLHGEMSNEYPDYQKKLQDDLVYAGFALTLIFGFFTIISLFVAVAVLNSLREVVKDYNYASHSLEKMIKRSRSELFILSENPAFLQVLDPRGLKNWQKALN